MTNETDCPMGQCLGSVPWDSGEIRPSGTDGTLGTGGTPRRTLPPRRSHQLVSFEFNGLQFVGGIGRFESGEIAEVFLNSTKFGSAAEASAQEAALVVSMALQHGCPLDTIRHALTAKGVAGGPLGALLLSLD